MPAVSGRRHPAGHAGGDHARHEGDGDGGHCGHDFRSVAGHQERGRRAQSPRTRARADGKVSAAVLTLDAPVFLWDYPTMTITADSKKRVVIPWVKPGDVFACEQRDENHFSLARLNPPPPPKKKTKAQIRRAILQSKMKFDLTWDELRVLTREP
jgi:hypothetical protein